MLIDILKAYFLIDFLFFTHLPHNTETGHERQLQAPPASWLHIIKQVQIPSGGWFRESAASACHQQHQQLRFPVIYTRLRISFHCQSGLKRHFWKLLMHPIVFIYFLSFFLPYFYVTIAKSWPHCWSRGYHVWLLTMRSRVRFPALLRF